MADEPKTYTQEQVDAMLAEQTAGLKANREEIAKEAKTAKAKLAAYDGVDPEKYRQLVAAAEEAERKKATAEGDFKQLEAQLVKKYETEIEKERTVSTRYRSAVERHLIDAAAASELAKYSDTPRLLLPHIRSRMKVVEQDGEFHARIVDDQGNVKIGKGQGSTPMTLPELIEEMRQDQEFAPAFRGSGSSGGGATKAAAGGGSQRVISADDGAAILANTKGILDGSVVVR